MAITSAVSDLFKSFYELIASVLGAAYAIVSSIVNAVVGFFTGILSLAGDVVGGAVDIAGGVGRFLAGNVFLIAIGGLAAFAYVRYTAQGQRVATSKKTN